MTPTSSAYAAIANIERVRRDYCKIGFVFVLADGSPVNAVSTQTFEMSFADESGLGVVTLPLVATLANRLEVTLSDAVRGKLSKSRYTYSLYNATLARTEVVGTFAWVQGNNKAAGLLIAPDFRVVYNSVAGIVINGLVVMDNTAPVVEAAKTAVLATKQAVDQIKIDVVNKATTATDKAQVASDKAQVASDKAQAATDKAADASGYASAALSARNDAIDAKTQATNKAAEALTSANTATNAAFTMALLFG